jgi:predicted nucleic acid-binding protein
MKGRKKRALQHACASQHQTQSENNSITIYLPMVTLNELVGGVYKITQKEEKLLEILT